MMNRLRAAATMVAALLTAAGPARAQQAAAPTVTLAEALRLAEQNAPAMVQARQNIRIAGAQERQAFGAFLPTVNANVSTTRAGTERFNAQTGQVVSTGDPYSENYGLSSTLDLFTGFRRGAQRRSASATSDQRDATLLRQQYATALETKRAFFNALASQELVAVAQVRVQRALRQMQLTSERLRLGATTRSDSLRAQVEYGNAQLSLITAQNDLRNAQATLARTIGVIGVVAPVPDPAFEVRLGTLDTATLRREAVAEAPTVREAEASVTAARAQVASNRAAYMPTVSANGSTSWSRSSGQLFGGRPLTQQWSLRLQLSYPIFNGFQRETQLTTADANARIAESQLRDARLVLEANLTQAFASLEAASARVDVSRVSVAAAEEDLRLQQERYRLGAATSVDVLTSQVSTDQALVDLVRARYDYLVARAQIEAYVGRGL